MLIFYSIFIIYCAIVLIIYDIFIIIYAIILITNASFLILNAIFYKNPLPSPQNPQIILKINLTKVLQARQITKPSSFLTALGFSKSTATAYKFGRVTTLNLRHIETLCEALQCTPNDIIEFIPTPQQQQQLPHHPLTPLIHHTKTQSIIQSLNSIPYSKLEQVENFISQIR